MMDKAEEWDDGVVDYGQDGIEAGHDGTAGKWMFLHSGIPTFHYSNLSPSGFGGMT
ncbi:MAG: hypothetical protein PHI39_05095 [Kiritimatiellae bacterium]|nr:hypothetical protein [Kiritimatiellia bacterium]